MMAGRNAERNTIGASHREIGRARFRGCSGTTDLRLDHQILRADGPVVHCLKMLISSPANVAIKMKLHWRGFIVTHNAPSSSNQTCRWWRCISSWPIITLHIHFCTTKWMPNRSPLVDLASSWKQTKACSAGRSSTSVGWWENSGSSVGSKWDVSEERLPGGGTATECSQTPANPAAVRAARLDRHIGLLILLNIWCTMAMYTIQHNEDNYCSTTSDWMFGTSLHPLFQLGLHHRHPPPLLCLPFEVGCGWPGPAEGSEAGTAGR